MFYDSLLSECGDHHPRNCKAKLWRYLVRPSVLALMSTVFCLLPWTHKLLRLVIPETCQERNMQLKTTVQDRLHQNSFDEYILSQFSWLLSKSWWQHIKHPHIITSRSKVKKNRWWIFGRVLRVTPPLRKRWPHKETSLCCFCGIIHLRLLVGWLVEMIELVGWWMLCVHQLENTLQAESEPKWDSAWFTQSSKARPRSSNAQVPETSDSWRCVGRDPKRRSNLKEHTKQTATSCYISGFYTHRIHVCYIW